MLNINRVIFGFKNVFKACLHFLLHKIMAVRPMKIDIMFLVSARVGFGQRIKSFHYSLFLKERPSKIRIIRFSNTLLPCTTVAIQNPKSFQKLSPAKHGDQSHIHTESALWHHHAWSSLPLLVYKKIMNNEN